MDREDVDYTYARYKEAVNMTYSELLKWDEDPRSQLASLTDAPIDRNLHLLSTPKREWGPLEVSEAKRTIAFIARMKKVKPGREVTPGMSKRDISLLNWAFNPFK